MPIYNSDKKEIVRILDSQGREIETVYDQNGVIVYTNAVEMTGTLPLSFYSLGKPLTDYRISGETIQDGTPSPDMPVDVVGCGERTENLLNQDSNGWERGYRIDSDGYAMWNGYYDASPYIEILPEKMYTLVDRNSGTGVYNAFYDADKNFISSFIAYGQQLYTATSPSNAKYIRCSVLSLARYPDAARQAMLIEGNTEPSAFIPYGYKLPLTVNGTEYPIYLGQVETTRRIKKLVFDGTEEWQNYYQAPNTYRLSISNTQSIGNPAICSHFVNSPISEIASGKFTVGSTWIYIRYADVADLADFKSYLAAQYAAGTPVTIWYVLYEPETGIVNEPLHKIGDYADTISFAQAGVTIPTVSGANVLDMTSAVKPSEVYIKGKIKPYTN